MAQAACASTWMHNENGHNPHARLVDPNVTADQRTYALFMHLSLIATQIIPFAIVILPLIMWQIKKDDSRFLDDHGRETVNFHISLLLYSVGIVLLSLITCGLAAVAVVPLYILGIVGMIMGAIAANRGEYFRYPATIRLVGPPQ